MRPLEQSRFAVVVFKDRNWAKVTGWGKKIQSRSSRVQGRQGRNRKSQERSLAS